MLQTKYNCCLDNLTSAESLEVLTPKCKYDRRHRSNSPVDKQLLFYESPGLSITPTTESFVSSLILFSTPQKKSPKKKLLTESVLKNKLLTLQRMFVKKKTIYNKGFEKKKYNSKYFKKLCTIFYFQNKIFIKEF